MFYRTLEEIQGKFTHMLICNNLDGVSDALVITTEQPAEPGLTQVGTDHKMDHPPTPPEKLCVVVVQGHC